jgi:hypothetical protein
VTYAIALGHRIGLRAGVALGICLGMYGFAWLLVNWGAFYAFTLLAIPALGLLVMQYPAYGALFLAGIVPAISGLRRGLPVPGLRPSEILIAFCGSAILLAVANRRDRTPWKMFDWVALLYVLATVALGSWDLIDRGDGFSADAIGDLLGPLQFFILYRAVASVLTTSELRIKAIRWILYSSIPVSLLAILQQAGLGRFNSFMADLTGTAAGSSPTATGLVRATGPFPIWHSLAGYLFLVVMLGLGAYLEGSGRILGTRRLLYVLVPAVGALITTATLAPIFGALAGAALLGRAYGRMGRSILGVALAIFVVGFLFTPALSSRFEQQYGDTVTIQAAKGSDPIIPRTLAARYVIWTEQYVPAMSGHWATGWGPGVPPKVDWEWTESLYLTMVVRGGVPLLLIYLWLAGSTITRSRRLTRAPDFERSLLANVVFTGTIVLLFMQIITPYFVLAGPPHIYWALLGLLFGGVVRSRTEEPVREAPPERALALGARA